MSRVSLTEFATKLGQQKAAAALGMTQGSLSKALGAGREIYVTEHSDGTFTAQEHRPFPSQQKRSAA